MIPKIMCYIFGHKLWTNIFTGKTQVLTDRLTGDQVIVPVVRPCKNEVCPRCGRKI